MALPDELKLKDGDGVREVLTTKDGADLLRQAIQDAKPWEPEPEEYSAPEAGGDKIRARRMREDFWPFDPTHKFAPCTNHKPKVRGTDQANWRRLVLVPLLKIFWNEANSETGPPELKQDQTLPTKRKAEGTLSRLSACIPTRNSARPTFFNRRL